MRIEELYVEGFGHFFKYATGPLEAPLTVLHGPNEAGKSTLLAFVRTMLFGFPASRQAQFYPPLNGGRHGGRVTLCGDDGRRYVVERYAGPKGGECRVTVEDQVLDGGAVLGGLLGYASEAMYKAVFAFGLDELQSLKSLGDAEVGGRIYSAGMGASSLPAAMASTTKRSEALFKSGGSNQDVAKILAELHDAEVRLDEAKEQAAEYGRLVTRRNQVEVEREDARAKITELQARKAEMDRIRGAWDDWVTLSQLKEELAQIPAISDFPRDASTRLTATEQRIADAEEGRKEAGLDRDKLLDKVKPPITDEALLDDHEVIKRIQEGRKAFTDSIRDLPERRAELRGLDDALRKMLRDLGEGWDEDRLESFDTSVAIRDAVEQWRSRLETDSQHLREAEGAVTRAERALLEARERLGDAQEAVDKLPQPEVDGGEIKKRRGMLHAARTQLGEYRLARQQREQLEQQMGQIGPAVTSGPAVAFQWLLAFVAALASMVAGLAIGGSATVLGVAVGAVFAVVGVYLLLRGRPDAADGSALADMLRRQLDSAVENEEAEAARLKDLATSLVPGESTPTAQDLDAVEISLDAAREEAQDWVALRGHVDAALKEEQRAKRDAEDAAKANERGTKSLDKTRTGWLRWLVERGLPDGLAPVTVCDIVSKAEAARAQRGRVLDMRERIKAIEQDISEYRDIVAALAGRHDIATREDSNQGVLAAANILVERYENARETERQRKQDNKALNEAQALLDKREKLAADRLGELARLLALGGTSDPEEFRRKADEQERRRELERDLRECGLHLRKLSGSAKEYEGLLDALANASPEQLDAEAETARTDLEQMEGKRSDLDTEVGSVRERVQQLLGDEDASRLRAVRAVLVEQLRAKAREWAALTLARALLERTRAKFEQERQPDVIKHAEGFFERITDGRYRRLISPLGTQTVMVEQQDAKAKTPEQLSRGTQEQLYLALRFGLIREFGERATRLPVVVDEVLVNFDPARARRTAEAFVELSRTNQVLVFTCHPSTAQMLRDVCPEAKMITINAPDVLTAAGAF